MGDSETGKPHPAIALAAADWPRGRRVRFTTRAALGHELIEADSRRELQRVVALGRYELVVQDDELGYLALPPGSGRAHLPAAERSA